MKLPRTSTVELKDGTKLTLEIYGAKTLSEKDRAFINRFLPLAAGMIIDEVNREEPVPAKTKGTRKGGKK